MIDEFDKIVGRAVARTHAWLVQNAPVDTGEFRNSITFGKDPEGQWFIGSTDPKAEWIELGTPPHVIRAKDKKALYWKGARHPVKAVFHPGTKARNLFLDAAAKFEQFLEEEIIAATK